MKTRQQVIDEVNCSWTKDLIIRFLYVRLAPFFQRDLNFFFSNDDNKYNMFINFINNTSSDNVYVTCYSLVKYYQELFGKFNIDSVIVTTNNRKIPHYALIVRGDNDWYFIDPLKDLMNNQVGLKPQFYTIDISSFDINEKIIYSDIGILSVDYIKEIDDTLKLYQNGIYLDIIFELLHNELSTNKAYFYLSDYIGSNIDHRNKELFYAAKMKFINEHLVNISYIPGKIERSQYYSYMIGKVCNHSERKYSLVRCPSNLPIVVIFNSGFYLENKNDRGEYFLRLVEGGTDEIMRSILSGKEINSVNSFIKYMKKRK